jgi:hypothetical protein
MEPAWVKGTPQPAEESLAEKLVDERATESSTGAPHSSVSPYSAPSRSSRRGRRAPRRDDETRKRFSKTLCFFKLLTVFTILLSLFVVAANVLTVYNDSKHHTLDARSVLLRSYAVIFCAMIVLTELEWVGFLKLFAFLDNWIARGLAYTFVGLITWDQSSDYGTVFGAINQTVAFMMVGAGCLYALLGMACMKTVKEAERGLDYDELDA